VRERWDAVVRDSYEALTVEMTSARELCERLENENAQLNASLVTKMEEYDSCRHQLDEAVRRQADLEVTFSSCRDELERRELALSDAQAESARMSDTNSRLRDELCQLTDKCMNHCVVSCFQHLFKPVAKLDLS
jgi:chromosome segregation ATPase